ncbi:hypothetical protein EXIGLDRAFT_733763 [Exidia glandulosa HHB12029]|uniref:Uncharacterized protein n=1 Tax=Exidia glandulosa HHB12029 TaxID=1314781 RepID=A0A165KE13_EXIGL|nr:hypothetical protein EXIGLDRAFT_733763 [Exidia glandulosa HHB12029]
MSKRSWQADRVHCATPGKFLSEPSKRRCWTLGAPVNFGIYPRARSSPIVAIGKSVPREWVPEDRRNSEEAGKPKYGAGEA